MTQQLQQPLTSPDKGTAIINAYDRWSPKAITNGDFIPTPKFHIFELCLSIIRTPCGEWHGELVRVMGLEWNSLEFSTYEWVYHIETVGDPSEDWLTGRKREPSLADSLFKLTLDKRRWPCRHQSSTRLP
ncbi:hypothetical protein QGP82_02930 [Leptothoe sp. LEGE 181152]|nr:hypothetical protein [Leptothoe sp. LEGE 181152]